MRGLAASLMTFLLAWPPSAASQPGKDAAHVTAAQTRQDSVKTLNVEFKRIEVVSKGAMSEQADLPYRPKSPVPPKETTIESTNRLVLDGGKLRYEDNHASWKLPEGTLLKRSKVSLFDGTLAKTFFPNALSGAGDPVGVIEANAVHPDVKSFVLTPVTITVRGLRPVLCPYPVPEMSSTGATLPIDGAACQEYAVKFPGNLTVSCWLDPGRDYVVRRIRKQRNGRLSEQADIWYRPHDVCGWLPSSWVRNQYSPAGAILTHTKVEILDARVNDAQPAEHFDIRFPPGAQVFDHRVKKDYRVKSDGTMRELTVSGEELAGSVAQPGDSWWWQHKWFLVALGLTTGLVAIRYVGKKRKSGAA